jgi:CRP-like cAMP-binding protein
MTTAEKARVLLMAAHTLLTSSPQPADAMAALRSAIDKLGGFDRCIPMTAAQIAETLKLTRRHVFRLIVQLDIGAIEIGSGRTPAIYNGVEVIALISQKRDVA